MSAPLPIDDPPPPDSTTPLQSANQKARLTESGAPALLDVRPEQAFLASHHPDAANVPLETIGQRVHELPRRDMPLRIYDACSVRARWARSRLRARGFEAIAVANLPERTGWISGPARVHLWQPHALLTEALAIIDGMAASAKKSHLASRTSQRFAADLACGTGRDIVYLGMQGWKAVGFDILPDALERARDLARRSGVAVETQLADLEAAGRTLVGPLPRAGEGQTVEAAALPSMPRAFDLITIFNFLYRPLWPWVRDALRPGGWLVCETFVEPQRERFGRPRRAALVLRTGELQATFADWQIFVYREGLVGTRRIAASLIARKPAG